MSFKGIVKGGTVELEGGAELPDGATVEVELSHEEHPRSVQAPPKGSPQALLLALRPAAYCTDEDVKALRAAVEQGKRAATFVGPFDSLGETT